jgi:protein tyrosine phosphatase
MQNPLPEDFELFWEMILEKNIKLIILLSGNFEYERIKFESYWPEEGKILEFNNIKIECIKKENLINNVTGTRYLKIRKGEKIHEIKQIYVQSWDENNIPIDTASIIFNYIILEIDKYDNKNPILIHSLRGSGRVGTIIAIYNIYRCINIQKKNNISEPIINVFNVVRLLREQRIEMVSSAIQYKYILKFCLENI